MKRHLRAFPLILIAVFLTSLLPSTSMAASLKIYSIKNLNATVYVNQGYTLPKVVTAAMSNKSTQRVTVTWNPKSSVTSKAGTFVFKGTVRGYAKQVILTLKVLPAPIYKDSELARAVSLGIGKYANNSPITYKQFIQMLDVVIAKANPAVLLQWEKELPEVRASNKSMRRDEGMLAVFYAANALGTDYNKANSNDWCHINELINNSDWNKMLWNYPLFPGWDKPLQFESQKLNNYMTAAYFYSIGRVSLYAGERIFNYDSKKNSMRPADLLTHDEALLAALRLYDSVHKIINADSAKFETLTKQTNALAEKMLCVSNGSHPNWYGSYMDICSLRAKKGRSCIIKDDVAQIAGMGFNYVRFMLSYKDFSEEKNSTLVFYQDVLENIDRVVEWCAEYKIHICIGMYELPGISDKLDILENNENYQKAMLTWNVLSSRYADISSNLISYNLINEPNDSYFTDESYAGFAKDIISVIQANDKTHKLLVSDGMLSNGNDWKWDGGAPSKPDTLLSNNIMQTIHLYPYGAHKSGYLNLENWPYEHAQAVNNYVNGETPFCIKGDFKAGTVVTLYIDNVYGINCGGSLVCMADGSKITSYSLDNFAVGRDNCTNIEGDTAEFGGNGKTNGLMVNFTVPSACREISISPSGRSEFTMVDILIRMPSDTEHKYGVPENSVDNGFIYETGKYTTIYIYCAHAWDKKTSSITISHDGSYTVENEASCDVFDYETLRAHIKKWADWSKSTGTPIMCNEVGIPVSLSEKARIAYMRSVLELFKEYGISFCIFSDGWQCFTPIVSDANVKMGDTILPVDGSLKLSNGYWYDIEMLNLLREYMKK